MTDVVDFTQLFSETIARVRARMDQDANAGLTEDDPAWIDTREGSFYWDVTQPPAMECARLWDAMTETAAAAFPSSAWGDYLDEHGQTFNLVRNPAYSATGTLVFVATEPTLIASGTQASSVASQTGDTITYQTTDSGTTCSELSIPSNVAVVAATTGGHLAAGTRYYHVTALNQFGETTGSQDVSVTNTGTTSKNTVTWNPVAGASSYQVYSTTTANSYGQRVGSTVATNFIDDGTITPSGAEPQRNTTSGVSLPAQAVQAGEAGNVSAGAITSLDTVIPTVLTVNNPQGFQGGAEEESDEDFRTRILGAWKGASGGGNVADYKRWSAEEGIERTTVIPVWQGAGTVLVVAMQSDGEPVAQTIVDGLQTFLDPVAGQGQGQAPIGATVTVTTSTILNINIVAEVIPEFGFSLTGADNTIATQPAILASLGDYLTSLEPGGEVVFEHVQACFFVPGVHDITGVTVNGLTSGSISLGSGTTSQVARLGTTTFTEPSS